MKTATVGLYMIIFLAGVAKWLRQWVVVPPFAGSSPVVRPIKICYYCPITIKKIIFI